MIIASTLDFKLEQNLILCGLADAMQAMNGGDGGGGGHAYR